MKGNEIKGKDGKKYEALNWESNGNSVVKTYQ